MAFAPRRRLRREHARDRPAPSCDRSAHRRDAPAPGAQGREHHEKEDDQRERRHHRPVVQAVRDGIVGRKIGLTSKAVQEQLGVGEPDYGTLLDAMDVSAFEIAPFGAMIQPRIEAEIAVILGRDLESPTISLAEVTQAVACLLPALEIVDSRIKNWQISIFDTIADNASSAFFVTGTTPIDPKHIDLRLAGMVLEKNGAIASVGVGAACLGLHIGRLAEGQSGLGERHGRRGFSERHRPAGSLRGRARGSGWNHRG